MAIISSMETNHGFTVYVIETKDSRGEWQEEGAVYPTRRAADNELLRNWREQAGMRPENSRVVSQLR